MERYDSYKDSGVEWIGETPSHWTNLKLGYVGKLKSGNGFSDRLQGRDNGDYPFFKVSDTNNLGNGVFLKESKNYVSEDDYLIEKWFLFPKNTIVFPKIGMVLLMNKRRILNQSSFIDNNMMGLIPNGKLNYKYGYYYLTKVDLKDYCSDGTVPSIGESQINPIKIPLPPLSEQQQIVSFLDNKTSLIDSLIEKTQRKIELLKEKRTSLINDVVTKGLNPNVEMKDSGVEWIGEIPSHWETIKLKYQGEVIIGLSYSPDNVVDEGEESTLVMRSSNVQNGKTSFNDNVFVNSDIPDKLRTRENDILICSRNGSRRLIGKNCLIPKENEGLTWGVFMTVFRSKSPKFFYWLLNSPVFESQSGLFLTSTINQLTVSTLENMVVPFVSDIREQQQIVDYLDEHTQLIDKTISIEEKRIELLKEYRQSLISEVVTGKRKVVE